MLLGGTAPVVEACCGPNTADVQQDAAVTQAPGADLGVASGTSTIGSSTFAAVNGVPNTILQPRSDEVLVAGVLAAPVYGGLTVGQVLLIGGALAAIGIAWSLTWQDNLPRIAVPAPDLERARDEVQRKFGGLGNWVRDLVVPKPGTAPAPVPASPPQTVPQPTTPTAPNTNADEIAARNAQIIQMALAARQQYIAGITQLLEAAKQGRFADRDQVNTFLNGAEVLSNWFVQNGGQPFFTRDQRAAYTQSINNYRDAYAQAQQYATGITALLTNAANGQFADRNQVNTYFNNAETLSNWLANNGGQPFFTRAQRAQVTEAINEFRRQATQTRPTNPSTTPDQTTPNEEPPRRPPPDRPVPPRTDAPQQQIEQQLDTVVRQTSTIQQRVDRAAQLTQPQRDQLINDIIGQIDTLNTLDAQLRALPTGTTPGGRTLASRISTQREILRGLVQDVMIAGTNNPNEPGYEQTPGGILVPRNPQPSPPQAPSSPTPDENSGNIVPPPPPNPPTTTAPIPDEPEDDILKRLREQLEQAQQNIDTLETRFNQRREPTAREQLQRTRETAEAIQREREIVQRIKDAIEAYRQTLTPQRASALRTQFDRVLNNANTQLGRIRDLTGRIRRQPGGNLPGTESTNLAVRQVDNALRVWNRLHPTIQKTTVTIVGGAGTISILVTSTLR